MVRLRFLLLLALAAEGLVAQRGGPPRRIDNRETIQLPGGSRIEFRKFYSAAVGKKAEYSIFLPPSYDKDSSRRHPVIYYLHGMNNDHTSWAVPRYGDIPSRIEGLISAGKVPEFLMVHPDGENSFYTDFPDGSKKYEEFVCKELVEEIEKNFRARTGRANRALAGTSMGGYGALKIAFRHAELYASVAAESPIVLLGENPLEPAQNSAPERAQFFVRVLAPLFGQPFSPEHWKKNSLELLAHSADCQGLNIYFSYGTADRYNNLFPMEKGVRALDQILTERQIPHTFRVYEGEPHGWELVIAHLEETIPFLTQTFGAEKSP